MADLAAQPEDAGASLATGSVSRRLARAGPGRVPGPSAVTSRTPANPARVAARSGQAGGGPHPAVRPRPPRPTRASVHHRLDRNGRRGDGAPLRHLPPDLVLL